MENQDKVINHVKKEISAYLKDKTFQIPVVFSTRHASPSWAVEDVAEELGFKSFECFNCNYSSTPEFKRLTGFISSNRKPTILFIESFPDSQADLESSIQSYLKSAPSHVKVILHKFGPLPEYPSPVQLKVEKSRCLCPTTELFNRGCKCGGR